MKIAKEPTSSNLAIMSSTAGALGTGDRLAIDAGAGAGADVTDNVALASCEEPGLEGEGVKPGFAGSDGWRGERVSETFVDSVGIGDGSGFAGSDTTDSFGVAESLTVVGATEAALALARATAILSAALARIFLRWSICISSLLIFFTKSLTSPGLKSEQEYFSSCFGNGRHQLNWNGLSKSRKSVNPNAQISVNDSDPKLHFHSFGASLILFLASFVASSKPTFPSTPSTVALHGSRSNGVHNSFFHLIQFFSRSTIVLTVSLNTSPFGAVWRSSSVALLRVSWTHWASASSSVKSIWRERLRGVAHVALAVFVNVKR